MGIDHQNQNRPPVYVAYTSLVTPLGAGTSHNMDQLLQGESGIQIISREFGIKGSLPMSKVADEVLNGLDGRYSQHTRFDRLWMTCLDDLKTTCPIDFSSADTRVILSTTKGNIELLEHAADNPALWLDYSASLVAEKLGHPHQPMIISNACISGISALIVGRRLLQQGVCRHVLVLGCDVLSRFVLEGFQSFHAISQQPCKPFDADRNGITLGEASAAVVLSVDPLGDILLGEGVISNDANHISGPSRTGEELSYCIAESVRLNGLSIADADFISAHGTATEYNDEMESKAFAIAGLHEVPLFSLKGAYGHTLGAAGLLDIIISAECLRRNQVLPSIGFETLGVSGEVTVNHQLLEKEVNVAVKTASGFGGCNAAIVLFKASYSKTIA